MESKNNFKAYFFRKASCFLRGFALYYWLFLKKMNEWDRIPCGPANRKKENRMMKRTLALLLAMVMSLTLLAGCGSTQPDAPVSDVKAVTVEKAT